MHITFVQETSWKKDISLERPEGKQRTVLN